MGLRYDHTFNDYSKWMDIGPMSTICLHCGAFRFYGEPPGLCCGSGKINMPSFPKPPQPLLDLCDGTHRLSQHFLKNAKAYNSAFQMTSFGCNRRESDGWAPSFQVQGQIYHRIGSLLPIDGTPHQFLQLYFLDNATQATARHNIFSSLNYDLIEQLQDMLHTHNVHVRNFKNCRDTIAAYHGNLAECRVVIRQEKGATGLHARQLNVPSSQSIGVLFPGDSSGQRDIILQHRDESLQSISDRHCLYDALQYPLLLTQGTTGWHPDIQNDHRNAKIQPGPYYSFLLQARSHPLYPHHSKEKNHLHLMQKLYQQWIVDQGAKQESYRLAYHQSLNDNMIRGANFQDINDHMLLQDGDPSMIGRRTILHSSYAGGPRYMHQRQQDAFAYVREIGGAQIFATLTTNPKWLNITENLEAGENVVNRPDIVARVFHQKKQLFHKLMHDNALFGPLSAYISNTEFQKRELPHLHALFWLTNRLRPDDVDNVVCAELPDPNEDPTLHALVLTHMIHGPCGAFNPRSPCMKDGRCSKKFPFAYSMHTSMNEDGRSFPKYRRRSPEQGGFTAIKITGNRSGLPIETLITNQWV